VRRFWSSVIRPILDAANPEVVVEVGAGAGGHTRRLAKFCGSHEIALHVIDPAPGFDPSELDDEVVFHRRLSLEALPDVGPVDIALIDGDHNWYTVNQELTLLQRISQSAGRPTPLTVCHDVCWPYGRRDLYYDPERIPAEYRHPWERAGIMPGQSGLQADRGLNPDLANAADEGGPRNGVMTAIEDFVETANEPFEVTVLPVLHGLAVVSPRSRLDSNRRLERVIARLGTPHGLAELIPLVETERQRLLVTADERQRRLEGGS
jgi:Methyltransferase domain